MLKPFFLACVFLLLCSGTDAQHVKALSFTKGGYGDAGACLKNGMALRSLGINAIFVHRSSLTDDLYQAAKEEGVRLYVEFPPLNGKEYLDEHPDAWPINEKGER